MNPKTLEEMPRVDQVYYLVEELVERLSNTVWGSAAFDVEKGDARYKINKLIDRVIKQSNIALLERIEKEIIEQNEKLTIVGHRYGTETGEIKKYIGDGEEEWKVPRNELRASQRLKLDEIRKSL